MAVIFSDDFAYGTGTTASAAVPLDTSKWATTVVSSGTANAYSQAAKLQGVSASSYASADAKIPASDADFEVSFQFAKNTTSYITGLMQMQSSGTLAYNTTYGYNYPNGYLLYTDTTTVRLAKLTNFSGNAFIASVGTFAAGITLYNIRWRKVGTTHSIKMWAAGNAEPATWTTATESTPTSPLPAGIPHIGVRGTMILTIDNVSIDDLQATGGATVDASYTAQTMEANPAWMPGGTVTIVAPTSVGVNATATAMTASASMPAGVVTTNNVTRTPTSDYSGTAPTTATTLTISPSSQARITFDMTGLARPVSSATLRVTIASGTGAGTQAEAAGYLNGYNTVPGGTVTAGVVSGSTITYDVTNIAKQWANGTLTNYGVVLKNDPLTTTTTTVNSVEATDPALRPVLTITMTDGTVSTIAPVVGTATASMPDAYAHGGSSVTVTAVTASATLLAATVATDARVTVTALTAFADAPAATARAESPNAFISVPALTATAAMTAVDVSVNTQVTADAITAQANSLDATVTVANNTVVTAGVATAYAQLIPPAQATDEANDPYFLRLNQQLPITNAGDLWYRLDETAGTEAVNRRGGNGTYNGGMRLGGFGPESRRTVSFDGVDDYVRVYDNDQLAAYSRMEVVFKTDKATQTIATGSDYIYPSMFGGPVKKTGLEMVGGVIRVYGGGKAFTGRTRLDDNQWHHVVWTMSNGLCNIYIDGKLEFRRLLVEGGQINAVIDGIGGGPDYIDGQPTVQDPAMFFRGEMMEFVYDKDGTLDEAEIVKNYYAVFGIEPVYAQTMAATASMPDAKAKGNQMRALGLFYSTDNDATLDAANYYDKYNWTGLRTSGTKNTPLVYLSHYDAPVPFDMEGYKVFPKSVIRDEHASAQNDYLGGAYYDEVTGEQRYIDVTADIDASDYDMVFFITTPPRILPGSTNPAADVRHYEDLIDSVRRLQDETGLSIWAPQPEIAVALGVVDRVEAHSMLRESTGNEFQGNALGLYDARGPMVNPYVKGDPTDRGNEVAWADHYFDTHALNKYRVVASVEGLTDLGGWRIKDYYFGRYRDLWSPPFEGWDYEQLVNGLEVGMTEYYQQDFYDQSGSANYLRVHNLRRSVVAVPPANVKAGTVVMREVAKHWVGTTEVANPYADYATAIVVQPGDSLKGRPANGRIFVSFMAGVDDPGRSLLRQLIPANEQIADQRAWETDNQRQWDYTSNRVSAQATNLTTGSTVVVPSGTTQSIADLIGSLQNKNSLVSVNEVQLYPTEEVKRYTLIERGMNWLRNRVSYATGDKVVRVSTATATAEMPAVAAHAEKDVKFTAQPSLATATFVKPATVHDPDAKVNALPMTASAEITGWGQRINVAPMTADAEVVETFGMVFAGGEQIALTLHYVDATLYLKEDA